MPSIRLSMIKTKQQWLRWTTQRAHDVLGSQDWYNDHCSRQPIPSLSCLARPTIWQCQWIPTWLRFRTFIAAFKITPIGTRTWRFLTKYFLVVLINSLTLVKYGKIVPQFLENIKTLSMCLVSAFIPLKAVSMASDKARFKDVYAAKTDKFKKTEWERVWMNCVVYILTAVIRTLPVSNKRTWALWTPQVRQSQMKRWISLQTMMSHIQAKPIQKLMHIPPARLTLPDSRRIQLQTMHFLHTPRTVLLLKYHQMTPANFFLTQDLSLILPRNNSFFMTSRWSILYTSRI